MLGEGLDQHLDIESTSSDEALDNQLAFIQPNLKPCGSWHEFYTSVTSLQSPDWSCSSVLTQNAAKFVDGVLMKRFSDTMTTAKNESELASSCLGDIMQLGSLILENISNGVKDRSQFVKQKVEILVGKKRKYEMVNEYGIDEVAASYHNLTFLESNYSNAPRIDMVIRKKAGDYENQLNHTKCETLVHYTEQSKVKVEQYHCPSYRLLPWNLISFIQLQHFLSIEIDMQHIRSIQQAAYHCDRILRVTPNRTVAFAMLTDLRRTCIFVAARVENALDSFGRRIIRHYYSDIFQGKRLLRSELLSFLITPQNLFVREHAFQFPYELFTPQRSLGRGSSSSVLLVDYIFGENARDNLVLKISPNRSCVWTERLVLTHLHHQHASSLVADVRFPALIEDILPPNHPHWEPDCMILLRDVYTISQKALTQKHVLQIWDTLQFAHRAGYAHCDLRVPNVMLNDDGKAVLIDWSFARPIRCTPVTGNIPVEALPILPPLPPGLQYQRPTMITASAAVLHQMNNPDINVYITDEAVSVILLALQIMFPTATQLHTASHDVDTTLHHRESFFDAMVTRARQVGNDTAVKAMTAVRADLATLQGRQREQLQQQVVMEMVQRSVKNAFRCNVPVHMVHK